ncbi:TonB-dependent receptor [Piscinibacter gummiphilus]|nr:TonB-dependent receptor [Piscinibacter gummiphilus]
MTAHVPRRFLPSTVAAGCASLLAPWAAAQGAAEPVSLPEVTVTAERVENVLRRTPVSVGVVDSKEIERKGITQLNDLVGLVAGVSVPNGFSNMPQAVGIRGVGVSSPAMAQAVGIYIDDVPLIRGYATALWDLPDIERIEVLRGPQGTLYGQNATAGAVRYISIDPSADTNAWLSMGVGNLDAFEARGYANGPLGDGPLSASIAFSRKVNDGYARNATLDTDVNRIDATQFRAKLRWAASDTTSAVLAIDGLKDGSDTNTANFPAGGPPRVTYTPAGPGAFERQAGGASLKVESLLGDGLMFRSITGYRAYTDDPTIADFGGLATPQYVMSQRIEQQAFTQEFQLQGREAKRQWTVGTMFVSDRFDFQRGVDAYPAAGLVHSDARTHQETQDLGLYGQARQAVDERTGVIGGLRLYHTRQKAANAFARTDNTGTLVPVYSVDGLSTSDTGLLPRLGVDHQWSPDLYLYTSIAQGAKFGGYNRAAESVISAQTPTDPERVTTWEGGAKGRFLGGRLSANVAFFYNDYRDYLAALTNLVIGGVTVPDAVLVNAGKARTYGVDIDMAAKLSAQVDWTLSLELLKSRFDEFANPTGQASRDYVGNDLPNAPPVTLGTTLSYRQPFSNGAEANLDATLQYLKAQYTDVANTPELKAPDQTYVNLGANFIDPSRHWTFSLRVRNLFDKSYALLHTRIPVYGVHAVYYNPPRTLMFTARYDY